MNTLEYHTVIFQLYKNNRKWKILEIITNLPDTKELSADSVLENWLSRTNEFTEESLVKYINSKNILTNCHAYTKKEL